MNTDTKRLLKARAHAQRALQLNDELSFGGWWPRIHVTWPDQPATSRPATSRPATSKQLQTGDYKIDLCTKTIEDFEDLACNV